MLNIFFPGHLPNLYDSGDGKNTSYNKINDVLIVTDFVGYESSAQNKKQCRCKHTNGSTGSIAVIIFPLRQHNFFLEKYRTPPKPKRDLHRIDAINNDA